MPRVVLFPALGTDSRLYAGQRAAIAGVETPDWPPPREGESLRDYSRRWAEALGLREPAVLGGVSMGGMIALEMAQRVGARGVVLIGSCRRPESTSVLLRTAEAISRLASEEFLDHGRVLAPVFLGRGGSIPAADRDLLVRMANELPVSLIRWAARAIMEWEGCEDPGVPVHHIHGDHDWAIPIWRVRPTKIVKGGAHVLNMSHPREVNEFIAGVAAGGSPSTAERPR